MQDTALTPLRQGWAPALARLLGSAEQSAVIASAFVTRFGVEFVVEHLSHVVRDRGELTLVTDLSPTHAAQGATEPEALRVLFSVCTRFSLVHLSRLHGKVYIADARDAIVTSGNLTRGGLFANHEYGLLLNGRAAVEDVQRDVQDLAGLGVQVRPTDLDAFCSVTARAREALAEAAPKGEAAARYRQAVEEARDTLLRGYAVHEPIHAVFERTVLYLLRREGPLTTPELHRHVQALHPDLCTEQDRIIGGENFGRKWKHAVRTAQQHLRQRGQIIRNESSRTWRVSGAS